MSTDTNPGPGITGDAAASDAKENNRRMRRVLFGCAAVTVLTTLAIFFVLIDNAVSYFFGARATEIALGASADRTVTFTQFLNVSELLAGEARWAPDHATPGHNAWPIIFGTLSITVGAAFVSIPIGTATALYISEYSSRSVRAKLKPTLEVLAGIPTIVYGYFAIAFINPVVLGPIAGLFGINIGRYSMLSGMLVVGFMTIPMVSSISEDAMQAVPDDLRNGAYALGATKYDVSLNVVIPAAISGIFASYILAVSRAIGETMAVTLAAGFNANVTANPFSEIMTMTSYMVSMARGTSAIGTVEYQSLFAVGLVLFCMTLTMNLLNDWFKRRFQEEYR
ncbi:phosphate ABC transporter permease subunit PstC [Halorubrum sp. JWXQ-INN 858]|uniref:phosphate ABC transporter permease subunit PstC n=1 Tax=Halorubrum sp. JWXQ-INN 858 TaxID=2690782 RepID=UPI00135B3CE2|nr:phosphate ABC transporter permease subunit PstC [Halorubrum sp. JWXQ-INN 858]MWV65351.1 phosphate ABC transporter permease subunit PstC [Halorubrum sp. JWXQ-INN 858]